MANGKIPTETSTVYLRSRFDGISGRSSEADILKRAAEKINERDALTERLRELDNEISGLCLEFSAASGSWGINLTILRREMKLRGIA